MDFGNKIVINRVDAEFLIDFLQRFIDSNSSFCCLLTDDNNKIVALLKDV